MGLDPALEQKLRVHDDEEVRRGGQILERWSDVCDDDVPRKCQDCAWAFLFLLTGGFLLMLALDPRAVDKFDGNSKYMNPLLASTVVSAITAVALLHVAKSCTEAFIYTALLFGPTLTIVVGCVLLAAWGLPLLARLMGLAIIAVGLCGLFCALLCWRHLIPFTVLIIKTVTDVIEKHASMIGLAFLGCLLMSIWCVICACGLAAVYLLHAHRINNFHESVPVAGEVILFVNCFIAFWGAAVVAGSCQVAACGVFGRWYFCRDDASPVSKSTRVAFTTSFGSVCFGSAAIAFFQALEAVARSVRRQAQEDCNVVVCIVALILESIIACIGSIVEWFCTFSYVQCAIRGVGLLDAARITYSLCTYANIDLIISSWLVDTVVNFGTLLCGVAGGVGSLALGSGTGALLPGFIIGGLVGASTLQLLRSGAVTMCVCWAEFPDALSTLRPELHHNFCLAIAGWNEEATEMSAAGGGSAQEATAPEQQS